MKNKIIKLEEELRQAMLNNDTDKLDELIDDSLVFIGPSGLIVSKNMDLEAHKTKIQKMTLLAPAEQKILIQDDLAIVTVQMNIEGSFAETTISGNYRYLRIWRKTNDSFKIISGAVVQII